MRITHLCYAVTGLGYASPWSVNAGFIAGQERTLIIDTGSNSLSAATIYGYAHAVRPANRMRVINTERHFDHIGGNHFFAQQGVPIAAHFGVVRTESEFEAEIQEFNDSIANPVRRRLHEANVFFSGTRLKLPDEAISTDCRLELGACTVDVILTPGHTPTNLSIWQETDGVLYCGDCLTNGYTPNLDASSPPDWELWLHSLDRIEQLAPRHLVPGHGPILTDADEVSARIQHHRDIIHQALDRGYSPTSPQALFP